MTVRHDLIDKGQAVGDSEQLTARRSLPELKLAAVDKTGVSH